MLFASLAVMALQSEVARAGNARSYTFVNFGYSESSNTWYHEQDILSFANGMFDPAHTSILSANGPDARFVDNDGSGNFLRRPDGSLELKDSPLAAKTKPATLENFEAIYSGIAKSGDDSALVVIGDHGSNAGLAIWTDDESQGGGVLPPEKLFELQAQVPPSKTMQTIFLQCFAGSMLVDQKRSLPQAEAGLPEFLDKYYPRNRCGLALSRHDEMGQYFENGKDWRNSAWMDVFKSVHPVNLTNIRERLNRDADVAPTTVLTSDYMAEDILKFACQKDVRASLEKCEPTGALARLQASASGTFEQVCNMEAVEAELAAKTKAVEDAFMRPWMTVIYSNYWADKYIKMNDPELGPFIEQNAKLQYDLFQIQTEQVKGEEKAKMQKEVDELKKIVPADFLPRYMAKVTSMSQGFDPKFNDYLDKNCNLEFMNSELGVKLYPPYYTIARQPAQAKTCTLERKRLFTEFRRIQADRKVAEKRALETRAGLVNGLLIKYPGLKPFKDRYDNIKKCENDSLK